MVGLVLSPADLAVLQEKIEGWVAGLQLVGLSIRTHADPSAFISTLSGSQRHILGYLTEEVLRRQPEDIKQFLLETSILERLNGDLCNAVTARVDSHLVLERLVAVNLFLIPLDDVQYWYRYHHLFADLLRNLQQSWQRSHAETIHQRASRWYAEAGMAHEALQHALTASDYELTVRLIEQHAVELLMQGHAKTIEACLQALPPEWALHSPRANLAFAWMHLMRGSFAQAAPFVQQLQAIFARSPVEDASVQTEWLALQAFSLIGQGDPGQGQQLAGKALAIAPEGDSYVRGLAAHALATAYVVGGDYARGIETYQKAVLYSRAAGNFAAEMLCTGALVQMALQRGRLRFAFDLASQGVERVEHEGIVTPICAALYGSLAQVYYLRHQLDRARPYYLRAMQVSPLSAYSDTEIGYLVIQSRMLLADGDVDAAEAAISRAAELMRIAPPVWVREEVAAQQVRVCLSQSRVAEAEMVLQEQGFHSEGHFAIPELRPDQSVTPPIGLLYNSALRVLLSRTQAGNEFADLPGCLALASRLIDEALEAEFLPTAIESLLIRAQIHAALGDRAESLSDAAHALELAEPEGLVSIFVEEGLVIADLLAELLRQSQKYRIERSFIQGVLNACSAHNKQPDNQAAAGSHVGRMDTLLDPLSHRELEILCLIAEGRSNQEIADRLVLSLHTVKKHISNIFDKMGVTSRTQALALARQYELL